MLVLGFEDYRDQARRLAQALTVPYAEIEVHHFPDGESRVTLPAKLPQHVIICRSLNAPNSKLIELLLTAETARRSGAETLTLIAPYLCYMRQDIAFHPGEAVSQKIIGRFLAGLFDRVVTIDAHLHRIGKLDLALPGIRAVNLSAAPLFADFLKQRATSPLLVGPDSESAQWVSAIAHTAGYESVVAEKQRLDDRCVKISLPRRNYQGQAIVLIDDVISTGTTLISIADALFRAGARSIDALVTHALFDVTTQQKLLSSGIGHLWSTDSINHPSNTLLLDKLLAEAVNNLE